MTTLRQVVEVALRAQQASTQPLGVILAGHNGSGKSTMWRAHLSPRLKMPLVNADRMMLSILPEPDDDGVLPAWATTLRDTDEDWMKVAQKGVEAFVAQAMIRHVPFAMETVFSHWRELGGGRVESKIDLIKQMQAAGYFVLLFFVGLSNANISMARVGTRMAQGGHAVSPAKLMSRFPKTQHAIRFATDVADATIMVDNSDGTSKAFTACYAKIAGQLVFDRRDARAPVSASIREWLDIVNPRA